MSSTYLSRESYHAENRKGLLTRQLRILELLESHSEGLTNKEIAAILHWPINTVTPRVLELRTAGVVAKVCEKDDPETGRRSNVWGRRIGVQLGLGLDASWIGK